MKNLPAFKKNFDPLADEVKSILSKTTIIINMRLEDDGNNKRLENLQLLLIWIQTYFENTFDILIIEQDSKPRLDIKKLPIKNIRHHFLYNPKLFNRGWGFNVAVKHYCSNSAVVAFLDTDILLGHNFIDAIVRCASQYVAVSPYRNIYYTTDIEANGIIKNLNFDQLTNATAVSNPVTICGGITIVRKDVFDSVFGFEQYVGYAGEDRALDVTLLSYAGAGSIYICDDTYVHMYHPRETIDRTNTQAIMDHLQQTYGCKWSSDVSPRDYIHKNCNHKNKKQIQNAVERKSISYGDIDLYRSESPLTINGQRNDLFDSDGVLPKLSTAVDAGDYDYALHLLGSYKKKYFGEHDVFTAIHEERKQSILRQKQKEKIIDFLFIPHKRYHTDEFLDSVLILRSAGYTSLLLNISPPHPNEGAYQKQYDKLFLDFSDFIERDYYPRVIICANDWERPVAFPILRLANFYKIPTVALVEGVNDFHDVDVRIPGSGAHYRNAYGTAKHVLLNGEFDRKYFANSSRHFLTVGINRLTKLSQYTIARSKRISTKQARVLINLNFSYGVKKDQAQGWLDSIIKICVDNSLEYVISKHPQDNTQAASHKVSARSLYDELTECDVFLTRFSGAVFEALTIGSPIIYYNPGIEKISKFQNPLGAYIYVESKEELESSLNRILSKSLQFNREEFLNLHAGGVPGTGYSPATRIANALTSILDASEYDFNVAKVFKSSLKSFVNSNQSLVVNRIKNAEGPNSMQDYIIVESISFCKCLNVDIENLNNRVVVHQGILYLLRSDGIYPTLQLIRAEVWNAQIRDCPSIVIYEPDSDLSMLPKVGFVYDIRTLQKDLRPGVTFLIRAKNENRNIYFVLGSLRAVLRNKRFNAEVVFVDNASDDGTYAEVIRVCQENEIDNVFLYKYNINISKSGDEHSTLKEKGEMHRSLDTYYNWCLDKAGKYNVIKWDADFLAINDNLVEMLETFDLAGNNNTIAIWFSGKTLYKYRDSCYVNIDTEYNEFRVFSNLNGYKWDYAPRWEISSKHYMENCKKYIFAKSVFLELKDCETNEFAHRSNGTFIDSCPRDTRDNKLIELMRNQTISADTLRTCSLHPDEFIKIGFNPLLPINYDTAAFNDYECTFKELSGAQGYWVNNYSKSSNQVVFKNPDNIIIQGLWVGKRITDLNRLCIESFLAKGHCYVLYTYERVDNVPEEVVVMSAEKIVPSSQIYSFNNSFAGFSDLFRSKLMYEKGGWYVDLDIYCVNKFDIPGEIVFSLDHYPENGPTVFSKDGIQLFPVKGKYYCATNPLKLQAKSPVTIYVYKVVFCKLVIDKIFSTLCESNRDTDIDRKVLIDYLSGLRIFDDFNIFVVDVSLLPSVFTIDMLLGFAGLDINELGQKTWNEIGPKLITDAALRFNHSEYLYEPSWFQGQIPYYEVEKYISPDYDFSQNLKGDDTYSIDFFFTMWKNKNLLEKKDVIEGTFYKHLEKIVKRLL